MTTSKSNETLVEDEDYVINEDGLLVFTRSYHLKRGYCCKSGCLNCPYNFDPETGKVGVQSDTSSKS